MKFAVLIALCIAAVALAQTLCLPGEYQNGNYVCNNSPTVTIDLDDDEGTFTAVYPGGTCLYSGNAVVDDDGNMEVTDVTCRSQADCANNVNFNCQDFVITGITFDDNTCTDFTGTRNGATLACEYQPNQDDDDSSSGALFVPVLVVATLVAMLI